MGYVVISPRLPFTVDFLIAIKDRLRLTFPELEAKMIYPGYSLDYEMDFELFAQNTHFAPCFQDGASFL